MLRICRLKKGKTLRQVARELGVSEVGLCRIEKGQAYIPPAWRKKLINYYDVSPIEIFDPETGWPVLIKEE